MSKMSLLGNAIRSNCFVRNSKLNQGLPLLLRDSPKHFSTEAEQPQDSPPDRFLQTPTTAGLFYGKLFGTNKHTMKTDIISLLGGSKLTLDDVKVDYNRNFVPVGMMLRFPNWFTFDQAFKELTKRGRLYRLERGDRSEWDALTPYDGKAVLLQGIPRNALPDDVDRFLSGCEFDASSIQMVTRQTFGGPIRMAIVRFPSQTQAMNAFIKKNRSFCLNNQVLVRVLH